MMANAKKWMIVAVVMSLTAACGLTDEPVEPGEPSSAPVSTATEAAADGSLAEAVTVDSNGEGPAEAAAADDFDSPETVAFAPLSGHSNELAEDRFVQLINQERRDRGLGELKVYWDLVDDARTHSKLMDDTNDLHHNPELSKVTRPDYWARLGENVGRGPGTDSLHAAFMRSSGHRANILGDFTHVGVGVVKTDGTMWVTVVFMKTAVPGIERTYGPFTDDDFTTHELAIHKIWKAGLTYGCGDQNYCPNRTLTRGEMAAFLSRALKLPAAQGDHFRDDDGAWYEASANRMYESRITYGCGEARYCGGDHVTRGQMAAFLTRAFDLQASGTDHFDDDDGAFYERSANAMREAGFTYGCGERRYCGERSLTRAEMAAFLARALEL